MTAANHVLVVDDEEDLRGALADLLAKEGYAVSTAASGREAVSLAHGRPFDLVTMDLRMPGMGGVEALAELRRLHPHMPVLVLSGYTTPEDAAACLALGALEIIAKPFDFDQLLAAVGEAIRRGRREPAGASP